MQQLYGNWAYAAKDLIFLSCGRFCCHLGLTCSVDLIGVYTAISLFRKKKPVLTFRGHRMSLVLDKLPLRESSPSAWLDAVLADFDRFLIDHAACERKASALAMSFIAKFSDRVSIIEPMVALAREELAHFHEVYRLLAKRGLSIGADEKDPYVQKLLKAVRHGREEHFLDRLLISGVIEARGCERFYMVGDRLGEQGLGPFYTRLGREEAGHYKIFIRLAQNYFPDTVIRDRLDEVLDLESEIMLSIPHRPAVH